MRGGCSTDPQEAAQAFLPHMPRGELAVGSPGLGGKQNWTPWQVCTWLLKHLGAINQHQQPLGSTTVLTKHSWTSSVKWNPGEMKSGRNTKKLQIPKGEEVQPWDNSLFFWWYPKIPLCYFSWSDIPDLKNWSHYENLECSYHSCKRLWCLPARGLRSFLMKCLLCSVQSTGIAGKTFLQLLHRAFFRSCLVSSLCLCSAWHCGVGGSACLQQAALSHNKDMPL